MDGRRIDRVLVAPSAPAPTESVVNADFSD